MALISLQEAQAWCEPSKMTLAELDESLLGQVEAQVLGRLANAYDVATWVTEATTPRLVRALIAMQYVSLVYDRQYSADNDLNAWANRLARMIEAMIVGIFTGTIDLIDVETPATNQGGPLFYPKDNAVDDNGNPDSAKFSMGKVF